MKDKMGAATVSRTTSSRVRYDRLDSGNNALARDARFDVAGGYMEAPSRFFPSSDSACVFMHLVLHVALDVA